MLKMAMEEISFKKLAKLLEQIKKILNWLKEKKMKLIRKT